MRDDNRIRALLANASDCAARAQKVLDRAQAKLELDPTLYNVSDAEDAMKFAVRLLSSMKELLAESYTISPERLEENPASRALCVDVCYESSHILRCTMPNLPITKRRAAAEGYTDLYNEELMDKLRRNRPEAFQRFRQAYVIYVHHDMADTRKAAYYDNDNLAIKALLDIVLPLTCVDDAACICDNLYFYVPDDRKYTELWVVEKPYLSDWAGRHPEMPVLKDLWDFFLSQIQGEM